MKRTVVFPVFVIALASTSHAQTTCDIMAANMRQDILLQGTVAEQFRQHQAAVCTHNNSTYTSEKSPKFDLTVNVPDYVDGVLGTSSNDSNWQTNFSKFCSLDAATASSKASTSTYLQTASQNAYNAIVSCVQTLAQQRGIFGILKVNDHRGGFTITVSYRTGGSNKWELRSLHATPPSTDFSCDDNLHQASPVHPIEITTGGYVISCKKNASSEILVAANTSQGPLDTFQLKSLNDEIQDLKNRVDSVAASNAALETKIPEIALSGIDIVTDHSDPVQPRHSWGATEWEES